MRHRPELSPLSLNLEVEQIEWLQRQAAKEQRSVSQIARLLIAERMDQDERVAA